MKMEFIKYFIALVLLLFFSADALAQVNSDRQYKYVINLASSTDPAKPVMLKDRLLSQYHSYVVKLNNKSKYKYRLRLGFFTNKQEVQSVIKQAQKHFKGAWLDVVRPEDKIQMQKWKMSSIGIKARKPRLSKKILDKIRALMEQARVAMVSKKYVSAISLYTKVTQQPESLYHPEAQEYLGLARERNGQLAHAKAEYKIYLQKYLQDENATRVSQRLEALVTAYKDPKKSLKKSTKKDRMPEWQHYGVVLQFYNRDVVDTNRFGEVVTSSGLSTNVNYTSRLRNSDYKMKTNVAATHIYDFLDSETDDQRITSMYYDMISPSRSFNMRLGRQKGRSGGVVGRYDGADLGYQLTSKYKLRLISGFPFELNKSVDHRKDKRFHSLSLEVGPINKYWDASVFFLEQVADNVTDRKELGAEVRYRTPGTSFFSLFDYSIEFDTTNYFMAVLNKRLRNKTSLDVVIDYRKSPFLTTTSALQGQLGVSTLGDLLDTLTEDEIEKLSLDRTALYKSLTAIYTRSLSDKLQFNTDISISTLSDTIASGGVDAIQGTGNEYSYSAGLIANSLLMKDDVNIFSLRFSQLASSDVILLSLSSRYRINRSWQLNPRLKYDTRDYDDGRSITKLKPSLRVRYRRSTNWQFEMDIDYEDRESKSPLTGMENETSYSFYAGYIYSF